MKKLKLNRDVIVNIGDEEMNVLKGGSDWFCGGTGGTCNQATCVPEVCNQEPPTPRPTEMIVCGTGPCTSAPTPTPTPTPEMTLTTCAFWCA